MWFGWVRGLGSWIGPGPDDASSTQNNRVSKCFRAHRTQVFPFRELHGSVGFKEWPVDYETTRRRLTIAHDGEKDIHHLAAQTTFDTS